MINKNNIRSTKCSAGQKGLGGALPNNFIVVSFNRKVFMLCIKDKIENWVYKIFEIN